MSYKIIKDIPVFVYYLMKTILFLFLLFLSFDRKYGLLHLISVFQKWSASNYSVEVRKSKHTNHFREE